MYIKKILLIIVLAGIVIGGVFVYKVYDAFFFPNTKFNNDQAYVYISSKATYDQVTKILEPLLLDMNSFDAAAKRKGYTSGIRGGKFAIKKGMSNREIIGALRFNNIPVKVVFNNQETIADLAGRIASQIEADSISLLEAFNDTAFLEEKGFNKQNNLGMYIPNSYQCYWNISPEKFRNKMLSEYNNFWNDERKEKAKKIGLTPIEVSSLAAIVHKETVKIEERPRVAGLYLNRLRKKMSLQADPTVIYALKLHSRDFNRIIKRVYYKDLELDSPYNTYIHKGVPPGPIAMPDISAIDAVLNPEKHNYYYFVANVKKFGYHMFAKTLVQHNRNKEQYIRWINSKKIRR